MGAPGRVRATSWRRRAVSLVFAASACVAGVFFAQPEALAAGNLSTVVLTTTFPGMVAAAPGGNNGPLGGANLGYLPVSTAVGAKLLLDLGTGQVLGGGYFRVWSRQPPNGDAVSIFAIPFKTSAVEQSWLDEVDAGLKSQPGATMFAVPGVPGAEGYTARVMTSAGIPATGDAVTFDSGNTFFVLMIATATGDLTIADAVSLATRQAANAPGASSTSSNTMAYETGGAVGVALLVGLFVMLTRRTRNRAVTHTVQRSSFQTYTAQSNTAQSNTVQTNTIRTNTVRTSSSSYPALPSEPLEPGWTVVGDSDSEWYWDGRAWTDRRQLTPAESE
jgi:hypothetical protein